MARPVVQLPTEAVDGVDNMPVTCVGLAVQRLEVKMASNGVKWRWGKWRWGKWRCCIVDSISLNSARKCVKIALLSTRTGTKRQEWDLKRGLPKAVDTRDVMGVVNSGLRGKVRESEEK